LFQQGRGAGRVVDGRAPAVDDPVAAVAGEGGAVGEAPQGGPCAEVSEPPLDVAGADRADLDGDRCGVAEPRDPLLGGGRGGTARPVAGRGRTTSRRIRGDRIRTGDLLPPRRTGGTNHTSQKPAPSPTYSSSGDIPPSQ